MPVDMDHAVDRHKDSEAPAAGWIEDLAAAQTTQGGRQCHPDLRRPCRIIRDRLRTPGHFRYQTI